MPSSKMISVFKKQKCKMSQVRTFTRRKHKDSAAVEEPNALFWNLNRHGDECVPQKQGTSLLYVLHML